MKISAVIITFNEEKNIERCLLSLINLVDEIIVVDSFSNDKTEEICNKYNVKFIRHKFSGHIEQKNWAAKQAQFDYILSLDADESISNELFESIQKVKGTPNFDGYKMNRLTNYCGKWIRHSCWYPDTKLRLWKNGKGLWEGENPHDEFRLLDKNQKISHLKGDILHYSYYHPEEFDKQIEFFTTIAAKSHIEKGKSIFFFKKYLSGITRFFKCYFFRLGFLDGKEGWTISTKSAYAAYLKYKKVEMYKKLQ